MRLVTQLTHLPLDALAGIAVLLHPHTLHALSCTSKSMKLAIESLQQANWFALLNLRHAISEIENKLIKSHGIRSFDREISQEEALGGFMPAWQHSFWQEHMYKVQFSKLPVSYTIALLKLTGFNCGSLGALGVRSLCRSLTQIDWSRSAPQAKVQNALHFLLTDTNSPTWLDTRCDPNLLIVWACAVGRLQIIQMVVANYWDRTTESREFALETAACFGHLDIVDFLIQECEVDPSSNKNAALERASANGHLHIVGRFLNDKRVDPAYGSSNALISACKKGHTKTVEVLLEDGRSDPTAQDNQALIYSARFGHTDVLSALLRDGRVCCDAQEGHALLTSSTGGHLQAVEALLKAGANLRLTRFQPFYLAVHSGHREVVRAYVKQSKGSEKLWIWFYVLIRAPLVGKYSLMDWLSMLFT